MALAPASDRSTRSISNAPASCWAFRRTATCGRCCRSGTRPALKRYACPPTPASREGAGRWTIWSAGSDSGRADALVAEPANQLGDDFVAAEGRHQIDALHQVSGVVQQLARLRKPLGNAVFACRSHAVAKLLRDHDAGDLVVHELGMP